MRRILPAVLATLIVVLAAGCGSSSSGGSSATSSATTTTGSTATSTGGSQTYTLTGQARTSSSAGWKSYPVVKVTCGSSPMVSANPENIPPALVCSSLAAFIAKPTKPCGNTGQSQGRVIIAGGPSNTHVVLPPFASCHLPDNLDRRDSVIAAIAFRTSPG